MRGPRRLLAAPPFGNPFRTALSLPGTSPSSQPHAAALALFPARAVGNPEVLVRPAGGRARTAVQVVRCPLLLRSDPWVRPEQRPAESPALADQLGMWSCHPGYRLVISFLAGQACVRQAGVRQAELHPRRHLTFARFCLRRTTISAELVGSLCHSYRVPVAAAEKALVKAARAGG